MKSETLERYYKTYRGIELLKKNNLVDYGIWEVRGEDPNPDLGGVHYEPLLGYYEGDLESVLKLAVRLHGFWQWGSGGRITKIKVEKL